MLSEPISGSTVPITANEPMPADNAVNAVTISGFFFTYSSAACVKSVSPSIAPPNCPTSSSPTVIFRFSKALLSNCNLLSVVSNLTAASSASAVFSAHAELERSSASVSIPSDDASASTAFESRTSVSPSASSTDTADIPDPSSFPRPLMNSATAPTASLRHAEANSFADIPAIFAKLSTFFEPVSTSVSMVLSSFEKAEPPASASMPTDESAVATASICGSVSPTTSPVEASRVAIATISASVVAKLLPSATIDEPRFEYSDSDIFVMFANFASAVAASLADRFVVTPSCAITSVKPRIFPVSIPSCPALSAIPASSVAAIGISSDILRRPPDSASSSSAVPSTVFFTPANADSYSIEAFAVAIIASRSFSAPSIAPDATIA